MQIFYFHLPSGSILGEANDTTAHTANANFYFHLPSGSILGEVWKKIIRSGICPRHAGQGFSL